MLDAKAIRKDFPVLDRTVHDGVPLVFLDSAASSQRPRAVIDTITDYYEHHHANVHRGVYQLAEEATARYEAARSKVARFIGAPEERSVIFTRSCTEGINLVANAWGRTFLREGDEIVITTMEHHSNTIPWQIVAQATGARIVEWPITDDGELDWDACPIGERTEAVAVTAMSNVLGTINPIDRVAEAAHAHGAVVVVDGAQSVPHLVTDVVAMGADFLALSGHKMLGPTGSGALWGRPELLEEMGPFLGGGEMIRQVWIDRATYAPIPMKFEAGTPPIAPSIGLGAAVDYLTALGMENVRAHEIEMTRYALDRLSKVEGITIYGPTDPGRRGGVVSFWLGDVHPHDVAQILDTKGVCVRAGHHCAQPLMRRLGVGATTRASFYVYNTTEEIDALATALDGAVEAFSSGAFL